MNDELSHKFIDQGWNHELGPSEWKSEAEVMERAEFWEIFRDCLSKLPARVVDVFMLREMEEMETVQICEVLEFRRITCGPASSVNHMASPPGSGTITIGRLS